MRHNKMKGQVSLIVILFGFLAFSVYFGLMGGLQTMADSVGNEVGGVSGVFVKMTPLLFLFVIFIGIFLYAGTRQEQVG
jgi:hypothetical protein